MDIAVSTLMNDEGHALIDARYPIWELSTPFKEDQTPYFGEYSGKIANVTENGNGRRTNLRIQKDSEPRFFLHNTVTPPDGYFLLLNVFGRIFS